MNTQRKMRSTTMATYFQSSFTCKRRHGSPRPRPWAGAQPEPPGASASHGPSPVCQPASPPRSPRLRARPAEVTSGGKWLVQLRSGLGDTLGSAGSEEANVTAAVGSGWALCAPLPVPGGVPGGVPERGGDGGGRPLEDHQGPGCVVCRRGEGGRGGRPRRRSGHGRRGGVHPPRPCRTRTRSAWVTGAPRPGRGAGLRSPFWGRPGKRFPQCHFLL